MSQASSVPTQQTEALFTFLQPASATAIVPVVSNPPVTISSQTQKKTGYWATYMPLGKQCPTNYPMALNNNWSEEEEEEEEEWNSENRKKKN